MANREIRGTLATCIDCGTREYVSRSRDGGHEHKCDPCTGNYLMNDRAHRDAFGRRVCGACSKVLARLNMGPCCYACEDAGVRIEAQEPTERNGWNIPQGTRDGILARWDGGGVTGAQIAREFNVSDWTVRSIIGSTRKANKRSPELDRLICEAYAAGGVSQERLSKRFGVPRSTIGMVVKRGMI